MPNQGTSFDQSGIHDYETREGRLARILNDIKTRNEERPQELTGNLAWPADDEHEE